MIALRHGPSGPIRFATLPVVASRYTWTPETGAVLDDLPATEEG